MSHHLLLSYKFQLIWVMINLQVLDWNHTELFLKGMIHPLRLSENDVIWVSYFFCVIIIMLSLSPWLVRNGFIIFRSFIITRATKKLWYPGWSFTRRGADDGFDPINLKFGCLLLFEKDLKLVLWGMQDHHVVILYATLISVCGVSIPLRKLLIFSSLFACRRIRRFMQINRMPCVVLLIICIYYYSLFLKRCCDVLPRHINWARVNGHWLVSISLIIGLRSLLQHLSFWLIFQLLRKWVHLFFRHFVKNTICLKNFKDSLFFSIRIN